MGTLGGAGTALDYYIGPQGMSNWKRGQTLARTKEANQSFDNSLAGTKRRALMSGFGYSQPSTEAGVQSNELARADRLSRIPGEVEAESVPITMQAIGMKNPIANTMAGMGSSYDPLGYYRTAADIDQYALDREFQEKMMDKKNKSSLFSSIFGAASNIIPAIFTGGASLPFTAAATSQKKYRV